jgi:S1-C subfamily serine protease
MVASNVLGNLPAYNAGIRWNDVIAKVDGKPTSSVEEFVKAYKESKGDEVSIEFIHKGQLKKAAISKSDVAKWEKDYKIGVHVESISDQLARHLGLDATQKSGLYVSGIVEDSPAEKAGLKTGDLLLKADGRPLKSTDVLNNLVRESQGRELALEYVRAGNTHIVNLSPAEQPESVARIQLRSYWATTIPDLEVVGRPPHPAADAATLERLAKAVEQLSKDVKQLKQELESQDK